MERDRLAVPISPNFKKISSIKKNEECFRQMADCCEDKSINFNGFSKINNFANVTFGEDGEKKQGEEKKGIEPQNSGENSKKDIDIKENHQSGGISLDELADWMLETYDFIVRDEVLFYYTGSIYEKVTKEKLMQLMQGKLPKRILKRIGSINKVKDVLVWLQNSPEVPKLSSWEWYISTRYLIAFKNGIYDAEADQFLNFSPKYLVSSQIDAKYTIELQPKPVWEEFLEITFVEDSDSKNLLWEVIGYLLMPCNDAKTLFVLGTAPDSGKSQLANFLTMVLGEEQVSHVGLHDIRHRFSLATIVGKMLNISMDLLQEPLDPKSVAGIKTLTGDRKIMTEAKFEDPKSAFSVCKYLCGTNHPVKLVSYDEAFWNRVQIIPFINSCPKAYQKLDLCEQWYAERDSIMTQAAWAAHRLIERNCEFWYSERAEQMLMEWSQLPCDDIEAFINEYCIVTRDPKDYIEVKKLFEAYYQFSESPVYIKKFTMLVRRRYLQGISGIKKRIDSSRVENVIFGLAWKE